MTPYRNNQEIVSTIQRLIAEQFGISVEEMLCGRRTERLAWPRQIAMVLAWSHTHAALESLATMFGKKCHSTVINAIEVVRERRNTNLRDQRAVCEAERRVAKELAVFSDDIVNKSNVFPSPGQPKVRQ